MKPVVDILEERISAAMREVSGEDASAVVTAAKDPKFGDYQANGVMPLAKKVKSDPRKLAEDIVRNLKLDDICEPPEIAGPGFINMRLKPSFVAERLLDINTDPQNRLGVEKVAQPQTVVVDFSGPNIAKQMHVGHLRSTIIGDCICRLLEFLGHKVIRQNHIGDWGTQFGMLITVLVEDGYLSTVKGEGSAYYVEGSPEVYLLDLERLYKDISQRCEEDSETAKKAREWTVRLQSDDAEAKVLWWQVKMITLDACLALYKRLGVTLEAKHTRGESEYKDMLPDVVSDLKKGEIAVDSDGAVCVFPEGFRNKEGEALPLIIQKSDGAYLYATTDLAALRYRVGELKADRVIYVTDARQNLHFQMVFAVARMAGWAKEETELIHVTFGSVLGENGKPLKTREGESVKLKDLLDEAVERAQRVVEEKNPELPPEKKERIAQAVGIGAVKYADYSNNCTSDYVFSFDKMLAMDGNTAPYMQYAYARIKSIERKGEIDFEKELAGLDKPSLIDDAELALAKHLLRYGEVIESAAADYRPNYLTAYLYELAQKFSGFYTDCPVLKAELVQRPTRLLLCDLTAATIRHGLSELLGIEVVERM